MKKRCAICDAEFKQNHPRQKFCCSNCRSKNWTRQNKDYMRKKQRAWRKSHPGYLGPARQGLVDRVDAIKAVTPCRDCGLMFPPCCMDFDHRAGTKHAEIGKMIAMTLPWKRIEAEIAKCDLVCANCHRIRTKGAGAKGWTRKTLEKDDEPKSRTANKSVSLVADAGGHVG